MVTSGNYTRPADTATPEVSGQVSAAEIGVAQVGPEQGGVAEIGLGEVGSAKAGSAQVGTTQIGAMQIGVMQADASKVGRGQGVPGSILVVPQCRRLHPAATVPDLNSTHQPDDISRVRQGS